MDVNSQEEKLWINRKRVDGGIWHMEEGDEDRKLGHVRIGRAVHAELRIESTLWAVSPVAD